MKTIDKLTNTDFFFCYTKVLSVHLRDSGIRYLFKANSVQDNATFTVYVKTDKLQQALDEYRKQES